MMIRSAPGVPRGPAGPDLSSFLQAYEPDGFACGLECGVGIVHLIGTAQDLARQVSDLLYIGERLMIDARAGLVFIFGCFALGGCAGPKDGDGVGVSDSQRHSASIADDGPVEIREERYPDGTVSLRTEGRLDREGNFIEHGVATLFWENGQKKTEINYVHGIMHGPRTSWYQSGQIWSQGQYVNGKEHGTWTGWFQDGRKSQETNFDHGAWHGMKIKWHANGQKKMQVEWVKGKRQGPMTIWDEQGDVSRQVEFVDNVPQP